MEREFQEPVREGSPAFILDAMLGRLARWLRILGYDTLYDPKARDDNLIRKALEEGRWLVTRDRQLAASKRRGLRTIFIISDTHREQLKEVLGKVHASPPALLTRCLLCNAVLQEISPEEADGKAPDYILSTQNDFRRCPVCQRIYWPGTHRLEILKMLQTLK